MRFYSIFFVLIMLKYIYKYFLSAKGFCLPTVNKGVCDLEFQDINGVVYDLFFAPVFICINEWFVGRYPRAGKEDAYGKTAVFRICARFVIRAGSGR